MDNSRSGLACSVEVVSVRHVRSSQSLLSKGYTYTELFRTGTALNMLSIGNADDITENPATLVRYGSRRRILSNIINIKEKFHTFTLIRRCH